MNIFFYYIIRMIRYMKIAFIPIYNLTFICYLVDNNLLYKSYDIYFDKYLSLTIYYIIGR